LLQSLEHLLDRRHILIVTASLQPFNDRALPLDMGAGFSEMPIDPVERAGNHGAVTLLLDQRPNTPTALCTARSVAVTCCAGFCATSR
jgi:hypothetical protein